MKKHLLTRIGYLAGSILIFARLERFKGIIQLGTLYPHGINERLPFL